MAPKTEAPEPAVDELKRRARRRLVGAVVVALAAAVILPMLLESDPKPLGDDVSIQIPPIDNSKFVTPLSPDKAPATKAAPDAKIDAAPATPAVDNTSPPAAPSPAATAPKRGLAEAEQHVLGQSAAKAANAPGAPVEAKSGPVVTPAAEAVETAPGNAASASPSVASRDSDATTATPPDAPSSKLPPPAASKVTATGTFQVQLAAFADVRLASDLARKVKTAGFPAHTEDIPTQQGSVHRVRVGPYGTRAAADAAAAKLKTIGYGGAQVVAAK